MVKVINESEFNDVIKEGNVVVDCFATWCGPCKMLGPILDNVSEELTDINFYKLDVDGATSIAKEYSIMSIPCILVFKEGKLDKKIVGLRSKDDLVNELK